MRLFFKFSFQEKKCSLYKDKMPGNLSSIIPVNKATEKKLSREQLLEVSQNISRYYAPKISHVSRNLVIIPIDPQKIFVYWNLGDEKAQAISSNEADNQLRLRVYSQQGQNKKNNNTKLFHDFVIHHSRSSQTITLPDSKTAMIYSASIGTKAPKNRFIPLITCTDIPSFNNVKEQYECKLNNADTIESAPSTVTYDFACRNKQMDLINADDIHQNSVFMKTHFASTNFSGLGISKQS